MIATDLTDKNIYGVVLYLNGQRIPGKKTFMKATSFAGYKKQGAGFADFRFNIVKDQEKELQR